MTEVFHRGSTGRAPTCHRALLALLIALGGLLAAPALMAHALGQSYAFIDVSDQHIGGRFEITLADLNRALELDFATDGSATETDLAARIEAIQGYLRARVAMAPDGRPRQFEFTGYKLLTIPKAQYASIGFSLGRFEQLPAYIDVDYAVLFDLDSSHSGLLVIQNDWKSSTFNDESNVVLTFSDAARKLRLDLTGASVFDGFMGMVRLGTHHILIGIDHVLFLLALLLPSVMRRGRDAWEPVPRFRSALFNLAKIVTVFTIAHSITLSLAALQVIVLPSRLVESAIAISIAIAAVDVIYPIFKQRIWWVVFAFGLFHGFGFASVLTEMGIPSSYMVWSLLGFNVGVEAGQLAIVCLIFPLLFLTRKLAVYRPLAMQGGAAALIAVSMYWFIERAFEIDLPAGELAQKLIAAVV